MPTFKIAYSGWKTVEVEAATADEAEEKFWDEGMNDLYDAEIGDIIEADKQFDGQFEEANNE